LAKCPKCKYKWPYKGKLYVARCPRCTALVKIGKPRKRHKATKPKPEKETGLIGGD